MQLLETPTHLLMPGLMVDNFSPHPGAFFISRVLPLLCKLELLQYILYSKYSQGFYSLVKQEHTHSDFRRGVLLLFLLHRKQQQQQ